MKKSKNQYNGSGNKRTNAAAQTEQADDFLIVGIGASAGGVQALKTFFANVPEKSGAAYVVILHLSPNHESRLPEILQTISKIPVQRINEKARVEPDHAYIVSPNESLSMRDGHIVVSPVLTIEERRAPIDIFFRTLGESHDGRSVAVVLSGTGADGSMGIKRVKEKGGAAFVQNPREAEFGEMPRNSIATDLVDEILNVAEIPQKIAAYKKNLGKISIPVEAESREEEQQLALREIFTLLKVRTGHDFANYKRPTVLRRIERRINVRTLASLPEYAAYLKENLDETNALLKDLLISVTNFFRDKEAFLHLERDVLPRILHEKKAGDQIRIWIAGCATGEEAYSLAMLLAEKIGHLSAQPKVQIFATDIDEDAIGAARNGFYTLNDAADVSPERLRRFFSTEKSGYRVRRELREMILFANHNLLKDPSFSQLDLVTCRNLLIYFNPEAQERVLETFHFALKPGGYLFLGSSESIDGAGDLFSAFNREQRIFQARQTAPRVIYPVPDLSPSLRFDRLPAKNENQENGDQKFERISYGDLHGRILEQFAPPSIIVSEDYDIVHISPNAGRFLQIAGGEITKNLFKLIHPDLRLPVTTAVYQAAQNQTNVKAENLRLNVGGEIETINVSVRPVLQTADEATRGFILVVFEISENETDATEAVLELNEPLNKQLEDELLKSQTKFRQSIERSEVQAEELKASNEELQAINEELRSTTEELETGKEELQSVNEELITVNQELKIKIEELASSVSDFQNLINSSHIGTIFLDRQFRVKMFTPAISGIFNLIAADVGRNLSDITHKLEDENLIADVETVLEKLQPIEREVRTADGDVFLMQITPYRTAEDKINGTIITFVNITRRKQAEEDLRESLNNLERQTRIFNTTLSSITDFAYVFDKEGQFTFSNQPLLDLLGITLEEIVGKNFHDLNYPDDLAERHQQEIKQVFETGKLIKAESSFTSPATGVHGFYEYIFNPVFAADGSVESVAGSTRDITERKRTEANLAFLSGFSQSLIHLSDEKQIIEVFGEKIYEMTGAAVCAFFEINKNQGDAEITAEWHHSENFTLAGKYDIPELVSDEFQKAMREGKTIVVPDIKRDLYVSGKQKLASFGIGSFVNVPLIRRGEWRFVLGVYHPEPHDWTQSEINLLVESANRIWTKLERLHAQKLVSESEERMRLIMNSVKDYAIITTDVNGIVNGWNPGAENMFGYSEREIVGTSADIIFTSEERENGVPEKEMRTALENGSAEDERFHLRKDGSRFYASGIMQPLKDGKLDGFVKIARDMTERIKIEQIQRDKEMLQKLVGAQEDERKRIARDLHDELGQKLTALRLKLESVRKICEDDETCGGIDEAQILAKHIDDGVDFLAWELRPAALDDLGLPAALKNYINEWSHFSGVTSEFRVVNLENERLLPEIETNLYRITQEALNNTHKYAQASRAEVALEKRDDTVILIIEDDGVGFDVENKKNRSKGIGLIGMQERAALVGGSVEIESGRGSGTTIFVRVPFAARDE